MVSIVDRKLGYGYDLMAILGLLDRLEEAAEENRRNFYELPIEEQERIREERAKDKEIIRVKACLEKGRCPQCGGRTIRGKKDKKNDNKREWICKLCELKFYY